MLHVVSGHKKKTPIKGVFSQPKLTIPNRLLIDPVSAISSVVAGAAGIDEAVTVKLVMANLNS